MTDRSDRFEVRPFPKIRRAYVDVLREGHRRHIIHGLVEFDVTDARRIVRESAEGPNPISFTGFIVNCVAEAVDGDRMVQAHRWGRNKLVLFEDVDVNLQLEQTTEDGTRIVQSRILRAANRKPLNEICDEIREAQSLGEGDERRLRGTMWLSSLPAFLRALIWRLVVARPKASKRFGGTVVVSSVGMFGTSLGWGIPITPAPLMVTVGGIGMRPVLVEGRIENREHLSVTISVDHDIVDGAPAARFVERLRQLVEQGFGLLD